MKIIDLLNKIANGENISNNYMKYFNRQDQEYDICLICLPNLTYKLDNDIIELNDEVEIFEGEKEIPEKLEYEESDENGEFSINGFTFDFEQKIQIIKTVNEIIDYLKSKGE